MCARVHQLPDLAQGMRGWVLLLARCGDLTFPRLCASSAQREPLHRKRVLVLQKPQSPLAGSETERRHVSRVDGRIEKIP